MANNNNKDEVKSLSEHSRVMPSTLHQSAVWMRFLDIFYDSDFSSQFCDFKWLQTFIFYGKKNLRIYLKNPYPLAVIITNLKKNYDSKNYHADENATMNLWMTFMNFTKRKKRSKN
jgi:hypothetical protein